MARGKAMARPQPDALDRPWRLWASIIILSVLAFSFVFGFLVLPVVQGYSVGIDPFTAICRAIGLSPGSPAVQQPRSDAKAAPTTQVAWSTDLLRTLSRPGESGLATAAVCAGCHGEHGIAPDPQFPNLADQSAIAIYKQLHDYKSGSRVNEIMTSIAQSLQDQDIINLSTHFASATETALEQKTGEVVDQDTLRLVERGDPVRGLPACNACHGFNSGGPIETPSLSRQNKEYLANQLHAFKSNSRRNDIYTRMRSIASKLTDQEIGTLATFYASTPAY
jgi:cytochrome c553